jgi:hypothetical protein
MKRRNLDACAVECENIQNEHCKTQRPAASKTEECRAMIAWEA